MEYNFWKYGQYKNDIFNKLDFKFEPNKKILDVGCGNGIDMEIFSKEFGLKVYGIDIYTDDSIKNIEKAEFKQAGIYKIPFEDNSFDYIFLHNVLHHIDEKNQSYEKHIEGLKELKRVANKDGSIIIIEGNRYNPLFYPHMVKMAGHNHWPQSYFKKVLKKVFNDIEFKFFEAHSYPWPLWFWKKYEYFMEKFSPIQLLAYNVAIIKNNK